MSNKDEMSNELMSDEEFDKKMDNAMAFVTLCSIVGLAVWSGASMFGVVCTVIGVLALIIVGHALADIAQYFRGVAK